MWRRVVQAGLAASSIAGLACVGAASPSARPEPAADPAMAADSPAQSVVMPGVARDGMHPPGVQYTVQAGDNLYAIALRFGTTSPALVALNSLANPNAIAPGKVLKVLPHGPAPSPPAPPSAASVVRLGDASRMLVAFSFDAGSDVGYTAQILDTLAANGIRASFGMAGAWAEKNPEMLRRIAAEGHHLINHSNTHPDFTTISSESRRGQLQATDDLIVAITGIGTRPYFRPPYGAYDATVNSDLAANGYHYSLMWSVDSLGWTGLTAAEIAGRCLSRAEPGAIYLFHVGSQSQDGPALQAMIDGLRSRGYSIGSVADVLGH